MIRKSCLSQNFYDSKFPVAEDFDLYSKISEHSEIANIAKFLVKYRINSKGLSKSNTEKMEQLSVQVIKEHAERLGIKLEENTIKYLRRPKTASRIAFEEIAEIEKTLILLKNLLSENTRFYKTAIDKVIQKYWFETCRRSTYNGLKILSIFFKSPLFCKKLSLKDNCRLFVRALIRF